MPMRSTRVLLLLVLLLVPCTLGVLSVVSVAEEGDASASASASAATAPTVSYYELLGVERTATMQVVKREYRRLALLHHPDKAKTDDERTEKSAFFVKLANAYEVLTSEMLRPRYDYLLSRGKLEYEERNWDGFDPVSRTFKRGAASSGGVTFGHGRFRFSTASDVFDQEEAQARAEAEAEEARALLISAAVALGCALMPAAWMLYQRVRGALAASSRQRETLSQMKDTSASSQARDRARQRETEAIRERSRLMNLQRKLAEQEEAAAVAAEEDEDADDATVNETSSSPSETAQPSAAASAKLADAGEGQDEDETVAGKKPNKDNDEDGDSDDDDASHSSKKKAKKSKGEFACDPCRKSFKSEAQLHNHFESNAHKKTMKQATRAN